MTDNCSRCGAVYGQDHLPECPGSNSAPEVDFDAIRARLQKAPPITNMGWSVDEEFRLLDKREEPGRAVRIATIRTAPPAAGSAPPKQHAQEITRWRGQRD